MDPLSPWAWATARWLEEVVTLRDVSVQWHVMCIDILHADDADDAPGRDWFRATWRAPRVVEAARAGHGDEAARALLFEIGRRTNVERNRDLDDVLAQSLAACALPAALIDQADADTFDAAVRTSHDAAMALAGSGIGTPVIVVPGVDGEPVGFFGPVVSPTPRGEAAGRLWDGLLLLAATPGFYELKKERRAKVWCD
jgi:hypothetical protein